MLVAHGNDDSKRLDSSYRAAAEAMLDGAVDGLMISDHLVAVVEFWVDLG
jgi:hypothetical protein